MVNKERGRTFLDQVLLCSDDTIGFQRGSNMFEILQTSFSSLVPSIAVQNHICIPIKLNTTLRNSQNQDYKAALKNSLFSHYCRLLATRISTYYHHVFLLSCGKSVSWPYFSSNTQCFYLSGATRGTQAGVKVMRREPSASVPNTLTFVACCTNYGGL